MAVAAPSIVVEDLSFRYPGRRRPALQNLSFSVAPGEMLLILGPSGGGKSTLALGLTGLIPRSVGGELSGRVIVGGHDTRDASVADLAHTVGLVLQDPDAQFCMLRVDDEIAFGLENLKIPRAEMMPRIARALEQVGLAGAERQRIDRLSGGGRQRLALACVLAMGPDVVIFDEPTSNLDPAGVEEVFANVARLKAAGTRTIVMIEHRLDQLMHLVDRVLVLDHDGQKLALAPPAEVFQEHATPLDELGIWIPQVSELANRAARRGVAVAPYPLTLGQGEVAFGRVVEAGVAVRYPGFRAASPPAPLHCGGEGSPDSPSPSRWRGGQGVRQPGAGVVPDPQKLRDASSQDPGPSPAVEISHLTYTYPGGRRALADVTMEVPEGDFFAIVGPNGAGKSTLASHLIGSIRPPAGTVRLLGRDVRQLDAAEVPRFVGYVFQNPEHQFVASTVYDELAFGLRVRKQPEAEIRARVEAMLDDFGLLAYARANPFSLSHGEKRRLSVATMLILGQKILVLDEPTFGQDRQNTDMLLEKLTALNRAGQTIVMITHDVRLVARYARRVAVFVDGAVAYLGPTEQLFADAALLERAHLVAPPVLELSRRLARRDGSFPAVSTTGAFLEALERPITGRLSIGGTEDRPDGGLPGMENEVIGPVTGHSSHSPFGRGRG